MSQMKRCLLVIILCLSSQNAIAQISTTASTGDYASDLGTLVGVIKTQGFIRDICIQQFSDMQKRLDDAYASWRERDKPFLQEIALRWSLLMIEDAKENNISLASNAEYFTGEMAKLRAGVKTILSQGGPEKFKSACQQYPVGLLGEIGNIEKHYPEHVETVRQVKIH